MGGHRPSLALHFLLNIDLGLAMFYISPTIGWVSLVVQIETQSGSLQYLLFLVFHPFSSPPNVPP